MSFFPLRTEAGCSWPAFARPAAARVWSMYQELDRTQWLSPAEIEAGQLAQARTLLTHAADHIPYYRRVLAEIGLQPHRMQTFADFRRIPPMTRMTFQAHFAEMQASRLPDGTAATGTAMTSGSTGVPVEVLQTNMVNLIWWAMYLRDAEWCKFDHHGSLAVIRTSKAKGAELEKAMRGLVFPIWNGGLAELMETGPCHFMDIRQAPQAQLEWLLRIQPQYLLSFTTNLESLARVAGEGGQRIGSLKAIQAIAETLTPETQACIEGAFGVPVKNTYSCTEVGYLASPCPKGPGLHVHAENVLLEVLDEAGNPCRPGQTGRVLVTSLQNLRAPFIRYDIGDEATLAAVPCTCGRGLLFLASVEGRSMPMFLLPDGRQRSCSSLYLGLEKMKVSYQFQVIQKAVDRVLIRLVPNKKWHPSMEGEIVKIAHTFFEAPVHVDIECLERFELPPGGKHRIVVSEIEDASLKRR